MSGNDSFFCSEELSGILSESSLQSQSEELENNSADENRFFLSSLATDFRCDLFLLKCEKDITTLTLSLSCDVTDNQVVAESVEDLRLNMYVPGTASLYSYMPILVKINAIEGIITLVCPHEPEEITYV